MIVSIMSHKPKTDTESKQTRALVFYCLIIVLLLSLGYQENLQSQSLAMKRILNKNRHKNKRPSKFCSYKRKNI